MKPELETPKVADDAFDKHIKDVEAGLDSHKHLANGAISIETDLEAALLQHAGRFMCQVNTRSFKTESTAERLVGPSVFCTTDSLWEAIDLAWQMNKLVKVAIEWHDVTYTVPVGRRKQRKQRVIIDASSGRVTPGHLLAVMGPTGCGKTSLISALAGRLPTGGRLDGNILVNGQPRTKSFRNVSSFVMQDDELFHNLTVWETFMVAAQLRLPQSMSKEGRVLVVRNVIAELGLSKCVNTYIGNAAMRGVSGGERKRANIGVEMMSNPSLIFMDEPSSGLDAFQAQNVMEALWNLAHAGRTVIATIHQPRSSIYRMFDLLFLLSEGKTMYFGPAAEATSYFARWGFACPPQYNPADFFLDLISMDYRTSEAETESRARIELLARAYRKASTEGKASILDTAGVLDTLTGIPNTFSFQTSWLRQARVLLWRAWMQASRDKILLVMSIVQVVAIACILSALYSSMGYTQKAVADRTGLLFFICISTAFGNVLAVAHTFPSEKSVVNRERAAKSYRVSPYYLTKLLAESPTRLLQTILFVCIMYWAVGFNPSAERFFIFICIHLLQAFAAQALGIAVSAAANSEKTAQVAAPGITVIFILFGGFYINSASIPVWLAWIRYISFMYYAYVALATNEFRGACCWICDPVPVGQSQGDCLRTGDQILDRLSLGGYETWQGVVGLVGMIILYNCIGYVNLRLTKPRYQPLQALKKRQ
ncbi:hypothetical protein WJX72_003105 [[Myrmecia] bisecta]|uniref:ABC transporter domain-containing protein n=1 Tax=[Myrmecia] bisecta TaxID=41462 RepID=A0AAW1P6C5_9CHLO